MLQNLKLARQHLRVRQELRKVDSQLAQVRRHEATEFMPQIVPNHRRGVVWRVFVPGKPDVFMCLPNYAGHRYFVVYVRGIAFYRAWLASGVGHYQACHLQRDMPNDYKFQDAVKGFAEGIKNPVPLADVGPGLSRKDGKLTIGFTDGMTRSFWLLANDAPIFPVMCNGLKAAEMLAEAIGVADPIQVSTLECQLERI